MTQPLVSFVIPVRGRPRELRCAIASCLAQSLENWEAVIVDDHSDGSVAAAVAGFDDPRLRYHRLPSGQSGVAAARQAAIALASSPILITLDADDISHPHRARRCLELLEIATPRLIYTRVRFFRDSDGRNWAKPILQPYTHELLKLFNFITNPGTAFNRAAYDAAGGHYDPSLTIAEDYDLYLRMGAAGVNILGLDEEHVSYRKSDASTTAGREGPMHEAIMRLRHKHGIPPFPLEAMRAHALPELCRNILEDPHAHALWSDDRWRGHD